MRPVRVFENGRVMEGRVRAVGSKTRLWAQRNSRFNIHHTRLPKIGKKEPLQGAFVMVSHP